MLRLILCLLFAERCCFNSKLKQRAGSLATLNCLPLQTEDLAK